MNDFTVSFYFASGTTNDCTLPEEDLYSFLNALSQRFVILKTEIINTNQVEKILIFEPGGNSVNVSQLLQEKAAVKKELKTVATLQLPIKDRKLRTMTNAPK
jgi:hypothetical protein